MYISRLRTVLTSAYLTGMLVSAVPTPRADSQLASAVNLGQLVSGLQAAGFSTASSQAQVVAPPAVANPPAPMVGDTIETPEAMARLIKFTRGVKEESTMDAKLSKIFGLNDGTTKIAVKQASEPVPEGKHVFILPKGKDGEKNIVIAYVRPDAVDFYLTNATGVLRAAAVTDAVNGLRLITNEQAAEKYKAEITLFAKLAKDLPPSEAAQVAAAGS